MDHIERVEAAMRAMDREPDRVFHEMYLVYVLHDCAGLAGMTPERRGELLDSVVTACITILCPPVAVNALGDEIYLLVQQNPWRSVQDLAHAAGAPLPRWRKDYSAVTICADDVDSVAAAINDGSIRALLSSWYGEE